MRRTVLIPNYTSCIFKNFFFLLVLLCLANISAFGQEGFITTWKTNNQGPTNNKSIKIPTTGNGYNYDVDWENDGTFDDFGVMGNITHEYATAGTYTVHIRGAFPRIYFNNGGDRKKILSIEQWGNISWTNMKNAFYGCKNLVCNATDIPDLSGVTNLSGMFRHRFLDGDSNFSGDLSSWDVSNVTDMRNMFENATSFNGDLSTWNVSNVTNMQSMFYNATSFNGDLSTWNVSNVTNMQSMFYNATSFNGDLSTWNVSNVTNMQSMFYNAHSFNGDLSSWDVSSVTNMSYMFLNADNFNGDLSSWVVSNVTDMSYMFRSATSFNSDLSAWDIDSVTYMASMFENAGSFNSDLSAWDIDSVTNMYHMLKNCGLSIENYDATLIGWKNQADTTNISLNLGSVQGLSYCNGQDARDSLINVYNWYIAGDVLDCGPLPVELLDFGARELENEQVLLSWTTGSEENNKGFELMRSRDGQRWETIGFVEGQGFSDAFTGYEFTDRSPHTGLNYYRLRQLDFDGNFEYSEVTSVNFESKDQLLSVFPNPAQDVLTLENASGQLEIFNALGQRVKTVFNPEPQASIDVSGLDSGYYVLKVLSGQEEQASVRFIKK